MKIEAVVFHHLDESLDEPVDHALLAVARAVLFRDRPLLGVRPEDQIHAGGGPRIGKMALRDYVWAPLSFSG